MASYNKVILLGHLTRDPELRYTPKGMAIAKFGLAVNRSWKSETGETREEVTFIDVDAFGRQAELVGQYFKKGSLFFMEGRLKLDSWDDKQTGQKRSKLGVILEGFQFVGSSGGAGRTDSAPQAARPAAPFVPPPAAAPVAPPPDMEAPPSEDDVPF